MRIEIEDTDTYVKLKDVVKFAMAPCATPDAQKIIILFFLDAVLLRRGVLDQPHSMNKCDQSSYDSGLVASKTKSKSLDFCEVCDALRNWARCTQPIAMKRSF